LAGPWAENRHAVRGFGPPGCSSSAFGINALERYDMSDLLSKLHRMEGAEGRPVFRRISEPSPEIEEAMSQGFTRLQIVRGLKELGIEISEATLSKYLFRIRRLKTAGSSAASHNRVLAAV
jgi:hypothetical protein